MDDGFFYIRHLFAYIGNSTFAEFKAARKPENASVPFWIKRGQTHLSASLGYPSLMQTKRLGNSDLQITPLGVGAWAIGGGGLPFAWGPQDDNDSIDAIHAALDRSINWIDTAPVYGLGHSENIVGRALQGN